MTSAATLDLTDFRRLREELKRFRSARVRVGVLGNKAERFDINKTKQDALNNPTLGLIHEFGTAGEGVNVPTGETGPGAVKTTTVFSRQPIPARSFLRMPLMQHLPAEVDKIGRAVWRAIVLKKGMLVALGDLGQLARNVVDRAFATRGFGNWAPNAPSTIRRKKSSAPLIDSAQLRRSVTWRVEPGKAAP